MSDVGLASRAPVGITIGVSAAASPWHPRRIVVCATVIVVASLAVLGFVLATTQATSRREARQRFESQATIAAGLTKAIFSAIVAPGAAAAAQTFGSATIDPRRLAALARASDLAYAMVVDGGGRVLATSRGGPSPGSSPSGGISTAVNRALEDRPWFSDLFRGPDHGYLLAEAVPFSTSFGRRVEVQVYPVAPFYRFLSGFLSGAIPDKSAHAFILDGDERFVGSSVPAAGAARMPTSGLLTVLASTPRPDSSVQGQYDVPSGTYRGARFLVAAPIGGTAWRVAITEPASTLYPTALGSQRWVIWSVFVLCALAALGCVFFLRQSLSRAAQLVAGSQLVQEVNAELEATNAELEATNDELEAFSYSVSHDLRAPLRAIDGFSRIVIEEDEGTLTDGQRRYLTLVCDSTRAMGALIDDLLVFSRLVIQPLNRQIVPTAELVADAERHLIRDGRSATEFVNGVLPAVEADPAMLRQVFSNLIDNAIKYTRHSSAPRIEVGSEEQTGELVFLVRDNGVGFDMRYADKLFEVFQRLHRSEDYEGTGVGLAIVRRIVSRHGGRVWADGKVGDGATFYFTLDARKVP